MFTYRFFSWVAVIIWMFVIFNLSSQAAEESSDLSAGITEMVVEAIKKVTPEVELDVRYLNHVVRKSAHFFSYLLLGILILNAFKLSNMVTGKSLLFTLIICVLYAVSDEVHQLFVPGREGQISDVLLDSAGACAGAAIYLIADFIITKLKQSFFRKTTK